MALKEYEIFKHTGCSGMYSSNTGLVVTAKTKKEAVRIGRKKFGPGTYNAHESNAEMRAEQVKRVAEVTKKLAEQTVPELYINEDGCLDVVEP